MDENIWYQRENLRKTLHLQFTGESIIKAPSSSEDDGTTRKGTAKDW